MEFSGDDVGELAALGITCVNFPGAARNTIVIHGDARSVKGFEIDLAGTDNVVELSGGRLPDGRIGMNGNRSRVTVVSDNEVNLLGYVYDDARVSIERPRAIFGLKLSVFSRTMLTIKPGCLIAEGVEIWTSDHHSIIDLASGRAINAPGDVVIWQDVWISAGAMVLKGVTLGRGSIVAARALITSDVPALELWGGVPGVCLRRNVSWTPPHPASAKDIAGLRDRVRRYKA